MSKKEPTTAVTTGPEVGELVPQAHGGALRHGGTNKGNPHPVGVIDGHLRTHCRGSFAQRVPILEQIADGHPLTFTKIVDGDTVTGQISANVKERISAIETLGKYGGVSDMPLMDEETPDGGLPTRADAERIWEALRRIDTIEELEKNLVARARKQIGKGE